MDLSKARWWMVARFIWFVGLWMGKKSWSILASLVGKARGLRHKLPKVKVDQNAIIIAVLWTSGIFAAALVIVGVGVIGYYIVGGLF
jgi:hypothetical protein